MSTAAATTVTLTPELRTRLKHQIDQARRQRLATIGTGCTRCGTPLEELTPSCVTCRERHRRRQTR